MVVNFRANFISSLANNKHYFLGLAWYIWETKITFFLANGRKEFCQVDPDQKVANAT